MIHDQQACYHGLTLYLCFVSFELNILFHIFPQVYNVPDGFFRFEYIIIRFVLVGSCLNLILHI